MIDWIVIHPDAVIFITIMIAAVVLAVKDAIGKGG
jgi:preprotein translocase subunit Sec61beta